MTGVQTCALPILTVYALAEYMDLKPRTVKTRLKDDGRFWIDGEKVGRKEPGSNG